MNIKNFSTKVPAARTVMEIEQLLMQLGATEIRKTNNGQFITEIIFMYEERGHKIAFKIPANFDKVHELLKKSKPTGISKQRANSREHAYNVGWRIVKDWIHSHLTMLQINAVSVPQLFLSYAYDQTSGKTVYELYSNNLNLLSKGESS